MLYTLMHRDIPVMDLELDEYSNIAVLGTIYHAEHLPLGTYNGINAEKKALNRWWTKRSIPASRKGIRDVLEELELSSPQELMALAEKILSGEVPPFCPHGRPCVLKLTRKELEKQFGRIV